MNSALDSDSKAKHFRIAIMVLVASGLVAIGAGSFAAHRGRANARAMRASVAKLNLHELLHRERACERGTVTGPDPAYCQAVARAVASQPLQLVDVRPDLVVRLPGPDQLAAYEHDPRSIAWPGKAAPTNHNLRQAPACSPVGSVCMVEP
jgi:hypothetical protein